MAHLSPQIQHRFLARLLSPEETLDVVKHLRECDACRERLLALRSDKPRSLLDSIVPEVSDEEHPSADSLGACLDEALTRLDKADLEEHLKSCELCRKALADLLAFREELSQLAPQEYAPVGISRSSHSDSRRGWFGPDKARFFLWLSRPLVLASVTVVAAVIVVFGVVIVRSPAPFGIGGAHSEPQLTVTDNDHQLLLGPNGFMNPPLGLPKDELAGISNLTSAVWRDEVPMLSSDVRDALTSLKRAPSVLLGQSLAAPPFHVISPVRTLISSERPTFRWTTAPSAQSYLVHVIADDRSQEEVATSPSMPGAQATICEWTIPESASLTPGKRYRWYVTATFGDQEIDTPGLEEPQAKFAVLSQEELARLAVSRKEIRNDRLIEGLLDLKAGLLDDAQAEFEGLSADPNQTPAARNFLTRMIAQIMRLKEK